MNWSLDCWIAEMWLTIDGASTQYLYVKNPLHSTIDLLLLMASVRRWNVVIGHLEHDAAFARLAAGARRRNAWCPKITGHFLENPLSISALVNGDYYVTCPHVCTTLVTIGIDRVVFDILPTRENKSIFCFFLAFFNLFVFLFLSYYLKQRQTNDLL
jgi:hypothetical protein